MTKSSNQDIDTKLRRDYRVRNFLETEAELLDNRDHQAWLECLTEDITYKMPLRHTRERGAGLENEFSDEMYHLVEDWGSLSARIERFDTEFAWSVDPPLRTRRFVTNIRVSDADNNEYSVRSNLLFHRSQGDTADGDIITAERRDRLRETDSGLKLAKRNVRLDHTILPTKNVPFFL